MSAFLSAGASLTPSPVTATTSPLSFRIDTTRILCLGVMRVKMISRCSQLLRSSSIGHQVEGGSFDEVRASSWTSPICRAMARAVLLPSPVIMMMRIPAS